MESVMLGDGRVLHLCLWKVKFESEVALQIRLTWAGFILNIPLSIHWGASASPLPTCEPAKGNAHLK